MKTLYESILDDIDVQMNKGQHDVLIDLLFDKDINNRRNSFEQLKSLVESYHSKQHKTTAKMKDSDSYFIQFTKSFKIKNGEVVDELMHYISYIYICKRTGPYGYRTTFINASDEQFGCNINDWIEKWQYTRGIFKPQSKGCMLYEVPKELNSLFEQIQMEANKRK